MIPIQSIIFYFFSAVLIACALIVVSSRNPIRCLMALILCFFATSILWLLIHAEFLALLLVFVYVGAVMTLFLFVVMMLNIDRTVVKEGFISYMPLGILMLILFVLSMVVVLSPHHLGFAWRADHLHQFANSNTQELGALLYSQYIYAFEVAAAILLSALIAAITLAYWGRRANTKRQNTLEQQRVRKSDRLSVVSMPVEKDI